MKNTRRLRVLCGELRPCGLFADVGCDHGYCTQYMLERGLCRAAVISDISAGSLRKAETLLAEHIASGRVRSVCCAGLSGVPRETEEVLIAGMGGEEIVSILEEGFLPPVLVLQPMKHAPKLRRFLLERGYAIERDFTFTDGKHYDLLRAVRGGAPRRYSPRDIAFGYDNLHTPSGEFVALLREEAEKCRARLAAAGKPVPAVEERLRELTEVIHEVTRGL